MDAMENAMNTTSKNKPVSVECGQSGPDSQSSGPNVSVASSLAVAASAEVLRQCAELLSSMSDAVYAGPSHVLPAGTIGKHMRHILDHFAAVLLSPGLDSVLMGAPIDYDRRRRNTPDETVRSAALGRIAACVREIESLGPGSDDRPVTVRLMLAADGSSAVLKTTLGRELAFAAHHAQHHLAMIAAIAREQGATVPSGLGKAPSTLNFERTNTNTNTNTNADADADAAVPR